MTGQLLFRTVDDRVMGGSSQSIFSMDTISSTETIGCWRGNLIAENGGFCSCNAVTSGWDFTDTSALQVTARAETVGRYKLSLKDGNCNEMGFSWQQEFEVGTDWATHELPLSHFVPMRRGRRVDCQPLDLRNIVQVGFLISLIGQKQPEINKPGSFALFLHSISKAGTCVVPIDAESTATHLWSGQLSC